MLLGRWLCCGPFALLSESSRRSVADHHAIMLPLVGVNPSELPFFVCLRALYFFRSFIVCSARSVILECEDQNVGCRAWNWKVLLFILTWNSNVCLRKPRGITSNNTCARSVKLQI